MSFATRLKNSLEGEVYFDDFNRGRYSTDASIYQIQPLGVVIPKSHGDVAATIAIAREEGVPLLPRGGGTSQAGQTVGRAIVVDFTKYLCKLTCANREKQICTVEPGIVLDDLNRQLKPLGLWFPVDVSTASRATIGGMAGNNSCGTRSLRYGIMRDRVLSIDAILADGTEARFAEMAPEAAWANAPSPAVELFRDLLALGRGPAAALAGAFPAVSRRVGGYNIDALVADGTPVNLATLLVGSEGTLAVSRRLELQLAPLPVSKALGVCHFPTFRAAMEAAQHIVRLEPVAVEVVDSTLIALARDIAMFRATMERFVRGEPGALLLTEFAEDDQKENLRRLKRLDELMGDLGHPNAVVHVVEPTSQQAIWEVRRAGLNIMMSMKSDGKPVSFIEDCAVPLEHLADYTERLTEIFTRHGTHGTWYAHASVGCLHVRPVLNLKLDQDVRTMRAIAEEAFELVRAYKGSHSGEHGDGLVRSEFHEPIYGRPMAELFERVKARFDPEARLNPGKIVHPPKMDDRSLFRYRPDYRVPPLATALDWSGYSGAGGGFQGAVEMCNNNGACRKLAGGVMCPSYRVTRNERDVTRGRANTLRLAISGQLGPDALGSEEMLETVKLCVSCKGCKRECPTGVDMAKMKIEVLAAANRRRPLPLRDRLIAYLPRYAPWAARLAPLLNLRNDVPGLAALGEALTGFSRKRPLPRWSRPFARDRLWGPDQGREVLLFADSFNSYFEPDNLEAAAAVLAAGGYRVRVAGAGTSGRPLCCGRTFLAAGLVDQARAEAKHFIDSVGDAIAKGTPIIGLEPSCLLTLRDEFLSLVPGETAGRLAAQAVLLEEFLAREAADGALSLPLQPRPGRALLHGHCHQKAFAAMEPVMTTLGLIPGLEVEAVETSCCGMAGAFGYNAETYDVSVKMAELDLLPRIRNAGSDTIYIADGFSCRHQIADLSGRKARHVARILKDALGT